MFDISSIEIAETFDVEIMHPATGEPLIGDGGKPCSVTVYGPGSKPFKAAQSVANNKAIKRLKAKGRGAESTPEEDAANTASFLSACTVSLNGFTYQGENEGRETFRALYADPKMGWLTEQVNREMGDWGNFMKGSSAS